MISQNLPYLFGEFENDLNVVLIQYPADMVRCSFYIWEKILLSVSSCDGIHCVLKFIALLVCLLIILFIYLFYNVRSFLRLVSDG